MASIKIKVGASLDASVLSVFQPLVKAAQKARVDIQKNLGGAFNQGPYRTNARKAEEPIENIGKKTKQVARITGANLKEIENQLKSFSDKAKQSLDISHVAKAAEAELKRMERAAGRAALGLGGGGAGGGRGGAIGIGRRAGIRVSRGAAALYGYGGAAAHMMLRGAGIDTDVSGMIQQGTENRDLAQRIVNEAPEYNSSSVAERQAGAASILKEAQGLGNATGTDTHEALEGMQAFLAKTGDLATARDVFGDLMRLTRATGTNFADMSNAAAEVSNNLGDIPNKGAAVYGVMKAVAGQGKLGAVVIRDLARQMAKIASQAAFFEGDRGKNIAILGAMAQESKLRGGSASATNAATSVTAFVANLTKGPTMKNWAAYGLNPYTDATHKTLRSPEELILEALKATGGDQVKMNKLFGSQQAVRATKGWTAIYNQAGGGEAGLKAVNEEFRRLQAGVMTEADVTNAFNAQMSTAKSQVQVFNNQMQQAADQIATDLMPATLELAHAFVPVIGALAHFAEDVLGVTRPKQEQEALDAQVGGTNFISKLLGFERTNLDRSGLVLGPGDTADAADVAKNMVRAEPIFAGGAKEISKLDAQIAKYEKALEGDKMSDAEGREYTDAEYKALAAGGNVGASHYVNDKATLDRLRDTQKDLTSELRLLREAIQTGGITVKLPPKPVTTDKSGTAAANSDSPGHD